MKKKLAALTAATLLIGACSTSPSLEDLTVVERGDEGSSLEAEVRDPDSVTIYRSVDQYRNILVMCVNGDAIVQRSNEAADYLPLHLLAGEHSLC